MIINTKFIASNLSFAQFQRATLYSVDLSDAYLYHTNFDNAQLCGVGFDGAYLRHATFWNANFDLATTTSLGRSAWWLAERRES